MGGGGQHKQGWLCSSVDASITFTFCLVGWWWAGQAGINSHLLLVLHYEVHIYTADAVLRRIVAHVEIIKMGNRIQDWGLGIGDWGGGVMAL